MNLESFLRASGIHFETLETSNRIGSADAARAVVVRGDLGYAVCVVPARGELDLLWAAEALQEFEVAVVEHAEAARLFGTGYTACPAGSAGSTTRIVVDERLRRSDHWIVYDGDPQRSFRVRRLDWERRLRPIVAEIARCPATLRG